MLASEEMSRLTHQLRNLITVLIVLRMSPLVLVRGCASCRFMSSFGFNMPSDAHFSKAITCSTNITGADLSHFFSRRSRWYGTSCSGTKWLANSNNPERIHLDLVRPRLLSLLSFGIAS